MNRRVGGTIAAAIALGLGAAPAAQAVHWPFFGGDNGRSGYQPVDEGETPLAATYAKTAASEQFVKTSIVTTTGSPATQRLIFGTRDGFVNFQILGTGAPVGPEEGTDIDEGTADLDVFGTRSMTPGGNGSSVSFADTSGPTGLGQLFAAHNDDDATPGAADIEIAQFDESSGSRVREDVDVAGTDGFTIESSLIATGPAMDDPNTGANEAGNRTLFFVASSGADSRLFRVPVTNNAASNGATLGPATSTVDIDATPFASPTIAFLSVNGTPTAHVAVGTATQLRTFRVSDLAAGPTSAALGGPVQTPSVPVQPSGLTPNPADPVRTAPFIYVAAATAGTTTTVAQLRQNADGTALETVSTSPALAGTPAPALATDQESEAPSPADAKVFVTTGANLYLLTTAGLDLAGQLDRESDLVPGTTGFAQTTAAGSGDFVYATNDQAQQFVLRLFDGKPVTPAEFTQQDGNPAAPNTGVGQPSLSRGFVQFSGGNGVFVYRNTDDTSPAVALTAPADGATISGSSVTFSATASDARGIASVSFRVNGQVVGTDTTPDSGSPFGAPGAVFSVTVDSTKLSNGNSVVDAVALDNGGLETTSAPRRATVQNGSPGGGSGGGTGGNTGGGATEDRPPAVAFTAPAGNALIGGTTTVSATASDDRGVRAVSFFDDDRLICTDTTAPYACPYTPRGEDVGRDTLFAIATDTTNQIAAAVRTIRVDRFAPGTVSARVSPGRDRRAPYRFRTSGTVGLPTGLTAANACDAGMVSVRVQAARKTISTRRVALSSNCAFTSSVSFRDDDRFTRSGRLTVRVRFLGNDVLKARSAPARTVRTR